MANLHSNADSLAKSLNGGYFFIENIVKLFWITRGSQGCNEFFVVIAFL